MEDATDIVPEQYTLTDSLDNDNRFSSFRIGTALMERGYLKLQCWDFSYVSSFELVVAELPVQVHQDREKASSPRPVPGVSAR